MLRDPRQRILAAIAEIVAKRGYQSTTVEHIVKRAGVARATFYENFENREACLLACLAEFVEAIRRVTAAAAATEPEWPGGIRAGLAAFLDYVAANPVLARTCMVESVTAGPTAIDCYEQAMGAFSPAFWRGRALVSATSELPETLEDSLVGGIVWMVHQRLLRGEVEEIPGLLPTMVEFALAPYLGERLAAEIAAVGP